MKKNKLFTSKMYKMQLGDEIQEGSEFLTRIPGRWIYHVNGTSCFIPYNNEFQKK